jgi:hypothetical protein
VLHIYTDPYELENVINTRIRSFLQSQGFLNVVVSRDLETDPMPDIMVWSRLIGPGVEVSEYFQREALQISISCADTLEKSGRERSSYLSNLLRAWLNSRDFHGEPITTSEAGSSPYLTNELDGFNRPAHTFPVSVYQTTSQLIV